MIDRACLLHLAATVRILEPTLVILQSKALRNLTALHRRQVERRDPANDHLEYAEFAGVATVIASFSNLAGHAPEGRGISCRHRYAITLVEPALAAAQVLLAEPPLHYGSAGRFTLLCCRSVEPAITSPLGCWQRRLQGRGVSAVARCPPATEARGHGLSALVRCRNGPAYN